MNKPGVSEDYPLPVPLQWTVRPLPVPLSRSPVGGGLQLPPFAVRKTAITTHANGTLDGVSGRLEYAFAEAP